MGCRSVYLPEPRMQLNDQQWGRTGLRQFLQLRPHLPGVPALLELRLGFFQGRRTIGAGHRRVNGQRPEPAQVVGTTPGPHDASEID